MKSIDEINFTTSQVNTKKAQQNNLLSSQLIIKESVSNRKADTITLQHLNYAKSDNIIKILDLSNNQQAHLIYSTLDNKVSANIVTKNGDIFNVHTENLPKELQQIKSAEVFNKFLENASIQVSILSDNEPKLYIRQKCYGGGGTQSTGRGSNGSDVGTGKYVNVSKDKTCPVGTIQVHSPYSANVDAGLKTCEYTVNGLISARSGIGAGDGYTSEGYPTGGGSGGVHGYSAYYDDDEDRYKYKGEYGLLGELDAKGMTGHGYTPRTQEALAYDNYDNLVPILVSPKRMAVWVNDLKTNPGRFQTTFYDKTMWSRPSYDPYMKRI